MNKRCNAPAKKLLDNIELCHDCFNKIKMGLRI